MSVTSKYSREYLATELWLNILELAPVTDRIVWTSVDKQFSAVGRILSFQKNVQKDLFAGAHPIIKAYANDVFSSDTSSLLSKLRRVFEYQVRVMVNFSRADSESFLASFSLRDRITPEFYANCKVRLHEQHLLFFGLGNLIPNQQIPQLFQNTQVIQAKGSSLYEIPSELFPFMSVTHVLNLEHNNISHLVLRAIATSNLQHVNVSRNDIRTIEGLDEQVEGSSLQELNLAVNCLTTFPSSLAKMPRLANLSLGQNRITTIPNDVESMLSLRNLDVAANHLIYVSSRISSLFLLETLNLSHNPNLGKIPDLTGLNRLVHLDISYTGISSLPKGIETLPLLEKVDANGNKIRKIPPSLGSAKALKNLNLSDNEISEVPEEISSMEALSELKLSGNKIKTIPESMKQMGQLQRVYLYGNPLSLTRDEAITFPFTISFKFKTYTEDSGSEMVPFVEKTKAPFWNNLGLDLFSRLFD